MLEEAQVKEIRSHLEKAQNPIFFFDNDTDGLCSFLLLRKYIDRGYGVAIKSYPELDASYARKIEELNADYVFVLDKPVVSEEFKEVVREKALPFVWIDHHDIEPGSLDGIDYYNPTKNEKNFPTTYLCYQITQRKQDLWIALAGCIADSYLPEFAEEAEKLYPDLWRKVKSAFEGVYETQLGKITRVMNFGLKDRTTNVVKMMKFLSEVEPVDVLEESNRNSSLRRYNQVNEKYQKLLNKAESFISRKRFVFFQYGGELSLSGDIANELMYKHPDKIIVVAYLKGDIANLSLRGDGVKEFMLEALKNIPDATGGGHEKAVGAKMRIEDLEIFKNKIEKLIKQI